MSAEHASGLPQKDVWLKCSNGPPQSCQWLWQSSCFPDAAVGSHHNGVTPAACNKTKPNPGVCTMFQGGSGGQDLPRDTFTLSNHPALATAPLELTDAGCRRCSLAIRSRAPLILILGESGRVRLPGPGTAGPGEVLVHQHIVAYDIDNGVPSAHDAAP